MSHDPQTFALERQAQDGTVRLTLRGELDLVGVAPLTAAVPQLDSEPAGHLIFDLRDLAFIDSSGMRVILQTDHDARRAGWRVTIVRGPAAVQRVFELLHVTDRLDMVDDLP